MAQGKPPILLFLSTYDMVCLFVALIPTHKQVKRMALAPFGLEIFVMKKIMMQGSALMGVAYSESHLMIDSQCA